MTPQKIQHLQRRVGAEPDGLWGPRSVAACRAHLSRLLPSPSPWPTPDEAGLRAFYGEPGDESRLVSIAFPYPMSYDGREVLRTRVHERCAESLLRVLADIHGRHGGEPAILAIATRYGGVFNFRRKRGGGTWSLHARGAAIDLDPGGNGFLMPWPHRARMPLEIIECFAREGWLSGAIAWGHDAMHFQATSR